MDKHRIIAIGAGFWGQQWIEAVKRTPDLELAAVVSRTDKTLADAAKACKLGKELCFNDHLQAMDRVKADIVVVVSVTQTHLQMVRAALEAGKHVICEKPLAESWKEGLEIRDLVKSHPKQKFMVSQTRRFTDQAATLQQVISSGAIGELNTILFDHRVYNTNPGWRQTIASPILNDMIIHHCDMFRYISGQEGVSVMGEAWNPPWSKFEGLASANVMFTLTNDVHINYFGTWAATGQLNDYDGQMKIIGSRGTLDLVDNQTLMLYRSDPTGAECLTPERVPMVQLDKHEIDAVIRVFLEAIEKDTEPQCNIDDNMKTFALNCAAIEAWHQDRRVSVQEMLQSPR